MYQLTGYYHMLLCDTRAGAGPGPKKDNDVLRRTLNTVLVARAYLRYRYITNFREDTHDKKGQRKPDFVAYKQQWCRRARSSPVSSLISS